MRTELCERLVIEHPIVGFSPSEQVVAAISRAGGLGVLGCVRYNEADELEKALAWLEDATDGRPYGVDVVMPSHVPTEGAATDLVKLIPPGHRDFVERTLLRLGVPPLGVDDLRYQHHAGDLPGMSARLIALGDDDVHAGRHVMTGVPGLPGQRRHQHAPLVGARDDVGRRGAERVRDQPGRMGESHLDVLPRHRVQPAEHAIAGRRAVG